LAHVRRRAQWDARELQPHCPSAQHLIPEELLANDSVLIGLVGMSGASKSHFLASGITALTSVNLSRFGVFAIISPSSVGQFADVYSGPLIDAHERIEFTQRTVEGEDRRPIVVRFTNIARQKTWNLVFFDASGEDLKKRATMARFHRHLAIADGVLVFLPPAAVPGLRIRLGQQQALQDIHGTTAMITEFLRMRDRRNTTASVILAKADQLLALPDFPRGLLAPVDYESIDLGELITQLDHETTVVAHFLENNGAQAVTSSIAAAIDTFCLAAASATGCDEVDGSYPAFHAMRCLEPILYLLYQHGLLSGANELVGMAELSGAHAHLPGARP
jgi:hypothetical protein